MVADVVTGRAQGDVHEGTASWTEPHCRRVRSPDARTHRGEQAEVVERTERRPDDTVPATERRTNA